jgi:hypothetical protein
LSFFVCVLLLLHLRLTKDPVLPAPSFLSPSLVLAAPGRIFVFFFYALHLSLSFFSCFSSSFSKQTKQQQTKNKRDV